MRLGLKILLTLMLLVTRANAFSLLGPYADWMQYTNGFHRPWDIGGPMDLGEEYRWNVPVLTYAFDQSFLEYFNSNGVAVVEQAIQILNDLPPASQIVLSNYAVESIQINDTADSLGLYDLKSMTLCLLLEQLGLAESIRNIFVLRQWDPLFLSNPYETTWPAGTIPQFILERNFDPETLVPTRFVNGVPWYGWAWNFGSFWDALDFPVDPTAPLNKPVSEKLQFDGQYYTGLTADDVGGLRYLLGTNNVNYETLLPGINGIGTNAGSYVNGAWRPGVEKITFLRRDYDSLLGQFFSPFTNRFTDTYITNNEVMQQSVERVVTHPDILFSAAVPHDPSQAFLYRRSGTSNWWNSSTSGGTPGFDGPGVICPPVNITFYTFGPSIYTDDVFESVVTYGGWASFDGSMNPPVVYPVGFVPSRELLIRLHLVSERGYTRIKTFTWQVPIPIGARAALQTSTNLINWVQVATVTNTGSYIDWDHRNRKFQRFFRVVPE